MGQITSGNGKTPQHNTEKSTQLIELSYRVSISKCRLLKLEGHPPDHSGVKPVTLWTPSAGVPTSTQLLPQFCKMEAVNINLLQRETLQWITCSLCKLSDSMKSLISYVAVLTGSDLYTSDRQGQNAAVSALVLSNISQPGLTKLKLV